MKRNKSSGKFWGTLCSKISVFCVILLAHQYENDFLTIIFFNHHLFARKSLFCEKVTHCVVPQFSRIFKNQIRISLDDLRLAGTVHPISYNIKVIIVFALAIRIATLVSVLPPIVSEHHIFLKTNIPKYQCMHNGAKISKKSRIFADPNLCLTGFPGEPFALQSSQPPSSPRRVQQNENRSPDLGWK